MSDQPTPPTRTQMVQVRVTPRLLQEIDQWAARHGTHRAEAIRHLLHGALHPTTPTTPTTHQ